MIQDGFTNEAPDQIELSYDRKEEEINCKHFITNREHEISEMRRKKFGNLSNF